MGKPCEHLLDVPADPMPPGGCEDCLATGGTWVHLRFCVACGRTLCCDDSPNKHARKHAAEHGHPVIRSKEPGENWAWCFEHETGITLPAA
ncbi:MAG: UBP-type zinc finger domain-containing protein [Acidimicrobiia bacterium]|nr:UBP-type zinc finger domain-containing protein [Acidimicrobiia bacterium]